MKFPITSKEVTAELLRSVNYTEIMGDLRIRQLYKLLEKVPDQILAEGLLAVFSITDRPDKLFTDQKKAGELLFKLNPKTDIDLISLLEDTVGNWNKSVEEYPFWLRNNYGIEKVLEAFCTIEGRNASKNELDKIATMKWWLKIEK